MENVVEAPASDPVMKSFYSNKARFADFINGTAFDGKQYLSANDIQDYPTEITDIIDFRDRVEAIAGIRDVVAKVSSSGTFMLVSLENQSQIDHQMALRELIYVAAEYNKQYRKYEHDYRERLKEEKKEAYQEGKERERQKRKPFILIPIIAPVFYYGKEEWSGKVRLLDGIEIPEMYKGLVNDWEVMIYDIKTLDIKKFRHPDNIAFIDTVQRIYRCKKDYESLRGIKLKREVAIAVASVTDRKHLMKYLVDKEEEEFDMYDSMRYFYDQSIEKGEARGTFKTIITLLKKKFGNLSEEVVIQIQSSTSEKLDKLTEEIFEVENEEDVRRIIS